MRQNHFVLRVVQIGFRFLDADARQRSCIHQILYAGQFLLSQFDSLAFGVPAGVSAGCAEVPAKRIKAPKDNKSTSNCRIGNFSVPYR